MSIYVIDEHYNGDFCGGLIGYSNYEACLETLGLSTSSRSSDVFFAFVECSILIEHRSQLVHIQSLGTDEPSTRVS